MSSEFVQGDRVEVRAGRDYFTGTITDVSTLRRIAVFEVLYDGGLGHGQHEASEMVHLASDDYPELGDILFERPDPVRHVAALQGSDEQWFRGLFGCHHPSCGRTLNIHQAGIGDAPRDGPGSAAWEARWHAKPELSEHIPGMMEGADAYRRSRGLFLPQHHADSLHSVMADRDRHGEIARHYAALPDHDPRALESFEAMRHEVHEQFHHLTHGMGIQVETKDHDPYRDHHEMAHDVAHNGRLQVMGTHVTGGHPLFSDEENDKFRAIHDAFGHLATRRGVDRNGEEAAWLHHASMFSPKARAALTTETRGQNAAMIHSGQFHHQKIALLPEKFWNDQALHSVKTAILHTADDIGSSSVDTGDSVQRTTDVGAIHNSDVANYPPGTRCAMCGLAPVELEVQHTPVCKSCAQSRFGMEVGAEPLAFGQTTAVLHEAMPWHHDPRMPGSMSPEKAQARSVRDAGFKGYVGTSYDADKAYQHHDNFDEDLWEKHAPEPTHHEQAHFDQHEEYPDSYHERHEEAYSKALEAKRREDTPDFDDDHLHHWISEHSVDPESFTRHAAQPQNVDLRHGVWATQSHVGQFHINRYLHGDDRSWHAQHGGDAAAYLGEKHPLFVTHQGRLHAIEGHHRIAAALQRGDSHIEGWHHDLDKHPIGRYEQGKCGLCTNYAYSRLHLHEAALVDPPSEPWIKREYNERGDYGNKSHITRDIDAIVPTHLVRYMGGAMGEHPGDHRNKHGQEWEDFKSDIDQNGIKNPIFITVDPGQRPKISEGNHRRDAAVSLGHTHVPVNIRYFGHSEQDTDLESKAKDHWEQLLRDHQRGVGKKPIMRRKANDEPIQESEPEETPDPTPPIYMGGPSGFGHSIWDMPERLYRRQRHFTLHAAWQDVQAKAARLRQEGKVKLLELPTPENPYLFGEVEGDHGFYHPIIHREGNRKLAYLCECVWGDYSEHGPKADLRAPNSPYRTRMCAHALGLIYELQSRSMFGKEPHLGAGNWGRAGWIDRTGKWLNIPPGKTHEDYTDNGDSVQHMDEQHAVRARSVGNQFNVQFVHPLTDRQRQRVLVESDKHSRVFVDVVRPHPSEYGQSIHSESGDASEAHRILEKAHRAARAPVEWHSDPDYPHQASKKVRKSEKPQKCEWCKSPATKSLGWAEGMAYIPTCDEHESKTRDHIENTNSDEVCFTHTVKQAAKKTVVPIKAGECYDKESPNPSREVSHEEYQALAEEGRKHLQSMQVESSPTKGLDKYWDIIKEHAHNQIQKDWGGATYDAHTGVPVHHQADKYALTARKPGQESVSMPHPVPKEEFHAAMDHAKKKFGRTLQYKNHCLGVFHDNEKGTVDIDPIVLVNSPHEVEAVGAYTHATGGAYHFKSGNGFFPPHVRDDHTAAYLTFEVVRDAARRSGQVLSDPEPHVHADGTPHHGVMVAFKIPQEIAVQMEVPGGERAREMHVTVGYLGRSDEVDEAALSRAIQALCAHHRPLSGKITGFGNFEVAPEYNDGHSHCHIGLISIPGFDELRQDLVAYLAVEGLDMDDKFGPQPHITIAYADEPMEYDEMPDVVGKEMTFNHLLVAHGSMWKHYPLDGDRCDCCGGTGEHVSGHECYRCDSSGRVSHEESLAPYCEDLSKEARGSTCPSCGEETPYHSFGCEQTQAPHKYWGKKDPEVLFQGQSETVAPFKSAPFARGYDKDLVTHRLSQPIEEHHLEDMDPRKLMATQPGVQRGALDHYMNGNKTPYVDAHNVGNKHPVVYSYTHPHTDQEEHMILSGHHRAAEALLNGHPLKALNIHGPVATRG